MAAETKKWMVLNNYDVIVQGGTKPTAMVETYFTVWKGMKENQEYTNGDYSEEKTTHLLYLRKK